MAVDRRGFGNTTKIGSILDRLNAGDQSARDELIEESFDRISLMASVQLKGFPRLRMKGRVDTADISHDVLMDLRATLGTIKIESGRHFINLAAQKIHWKLLDLARKYKKQMQLFGTNAEESGAHKVEKASQGFTIAPEGDGLSFDEWESFHLAVNELPDLQREAMWLRHYGGWSHAEIAAIVGISEDAAKKRYASAKKGLQQILGDFERTD